MAPASDLCGLCAVHVGTAPATTKSYSASSIACTQRITLIDQLWVKLDTNACTSKSAEHILDRISSSAFGNQVHTGRGALLNVRTKVIFSYVVGSL